MAENIKVEQLKDSDKPLLIDLFSQAFREYPIAPVRHIKPEVTRKIIKAFLTFFGSTKSSLLYGIQRDDKFVCASLSVDSSEKPSVLALIRFILSMSLALGRGAKEMEVIYKEMPKYEERYFELVLLGTLPEYQGRGIGSKMLYFLYDEAKRRDFKGVIFVVDRETPAFNLYLKEGFIVEKEFLWGKITLCWMRRML